MALSGCTLQPSPSLYEDSVAFCPKNVVDLQDAIQAAQRDGWTSAQAAPISDSNTASMKTISTYNFMKKSEKRALTLVQAVIFNKVHPNVVINMCMVIHNADPSYPGSLVKLRKWANVPGFHEKETGHENYSFTDANRTHRSIKESEVWKPGHGDRRQLIVFQSEKGYSEAALIATIN
jgi:hypothetical protein